MFGTSPQCDNFVNINPIEKISIYPLNVLLVLRHYLFENAFVIIYIFM